MSWSTWAGPVVLYVTWRLFDSPGGWAALLGVALGVGLIEGLVKGQREQHS